MMHLRHVTVVNQPGSRMPRASVAVLAITAALLSPTLRASGQADEPGSSEPGTGQAASQPPLFFDDFSSRTLLSPQPATAKWVTRVDDDATPQDPACSIAVDTQSEPPQLRIHDPSPSTKAAAFAIFQKTQGHTTVTVSLQYRLEPLAGYNPTLSLRDGFEDRLSLRWRGKQLECLDPQGQWTALGSAVLGTDSQLTLSVDQVAGTYTVQQDQQPVSEPQTLLGDSPAGFDRVVFVTGQCTASKVDWHIGRLEVTAATTDADNNHDRDGDSADQD